MSGCADVRHDLGVYALGALPSDEEAGVREHLARCQACRDEHARLAAMRPLLDLAEPASERTRPAPSPLLEEAVLAGFAAERRPVKRRRLSLPSPRVAIPSAALGAALAVTILALAGVFGGDATGGGDPATTVDLRGDAGSARATIAAADVGTEIDLDAKLPPSRSRADFYDVWLVRGGYRVSAGSFGVDADGRVRVTLTCGGRPELYDRITVTRHEGAGAPLVQATL